MLPPYERRMIVTCLSNIAERVRRVGPEAAALAEFVMEHRDALRLDVRIETDDSEGPFRRRRTWSLGESERIPEPDWERLRASLKSAKRALANAQPDLLARRLRRLAGEMDLNDTDVTILDLLVRYQASPAVESMVDEVGARFGRRVGSYVNVRHTPLPQLLGLARGEVLRRLADDAPLARSGIVSIDDDGDLNVVSRLRRLASAPARADTDMRGLLLDAAPPTELEWSDFDHVADERDHLRALAKGALRSGAKGVNVLLYGPPGTGKTEFSRVLAARIGAPLYAVGEADSDGGEPTGRERLMELRFAQRLTGAGARPLLLFDEMDDLLGDGGIERALFRRFGWRRAERSNVFLHRLIEGAPTPTLWTLNDPSVCSQAVLRRMTFALELRVPPPRVRARIWARQLERRGIEAGPAEARALAEEFDTAAGVAEGVIAAAGASGGGIEEVRRGVRSLRRAMRGNAPPPKPPAAFDPALLAADTDAEALAGRLAETGARAFSVCLQGPPGAGKSAYVRYLADRLGMEVLHRRASDLLDKFVGETEKAIAAAFAEARAAEAFLLFDEADSLLADRRFAHYNWEVSQTNEMLTWMEQHPLPFACATNFGERLDPATLRRFTFKIALDFLPPVKAEAAFRAFFALDPPPGLAELATLTPGDFAVVRRKAALLGQSGDPAALAAMLRAECNAKPDRARRIGFGR